MNEKSNKKFQLNKLTVQALNMQVDREEQKEVNGGSNNGYDAQATLTPVFC